jgi:cold shock protein
MPTGRVKFFNPDRGFGFITPDGGESDVFVHISAVEAAGMGSLAAGQLLAYDIGTARDAAQRPLIFDCLTPRGIMAPAINLRGSRMAMIEVRFSLEKGTKGALRTKRSTKGAVIEQSCVRIGTRYMQERVRAWCGIPVDAARDGRNWPRT